MLISANKQGRDMNISLIVMLSLPVLYLTGSLRKTVAKMKIGGTAFVAYFLAAAVLSMIPVVTVLPGLSMNIAGMFLCIAPAVYLAFKKDCGYKFLLASKLMILLAVLSHYLFLSLTLPAIKPMTGAAVAIVAICCLGYKAAPKAPALAGVYSVSENLMALLTGQMRTLYLFDAAELAVFCFMLCFAAASLALFVRQIKDKKVYIPEPPDTEVQKPHGPQIPEPKFPGIEFPEPEFPKPEFPEPQLEENSGLNADTEPLAPSLVPAEPKPSES